MKQITKLKNLVGGLTLSLVVVAATVTGALAAPQQGTQLADKPAVSGPQAKPAIEPGSKDAKATENLGPTSEVKVKPDGSPEAAASAAPAFGAVAGVDFQTFYNYCWKNLVYTTVRNTTAATKSIRIVLYNQGTSQNIYTTVAAGGAYTYPAFYGINGAYSAYLYVWNGSTYVYDEYKASNNTCRVAVTRTVNSGGWVQLKIQNTGTASATQVSTELAPFPGAGTYTGTHYDYPVAGGAAIYRWFQVGTQPYGITSYTSGGFNAPSFFSGDL